MKFSVVFLSALILYVSAGPLAEEPSVRGPSQSCKDNWTAVSTTLYLLTANVKLQLAQVATMQMLQLSYWFTGTTATLQLNIDCAQTLANNLNIAMGLSFPSLQMTNIQTYIQTTITAVQFSVSAVMAVDIATGQAMQAQLTIIQQNLTACVNEMKTAAMMAVWPATMMMVISDSTLQKLTQTVSAVATVQITCASAYSSANSASNVPALLMDIVTQTTAIAKATAAAAVNAAVSATVTATQSAVAAIISVQATAMQATASVAQVSMSTISQSVTVTYSILVQSLMLQTEFDVNVVVSGAADLEQGNSNCTSVIVQNITDTNTEFTAMCTESSDADNITATVQNYTQQITVIMQSSSSITVQMCANIAISGMIVEQTKGHNGIGQCVSDGKKNNDNDMAEVQQNFSSCAQENMQNLTNCCNKYKNTSYTGKSAANTDTGADKTQMMDSCKRKHTDKDMKKAKGDSDDKCKKHRKGGDNYEKVKKCKSDQKTQTVTNIIAIYAQFQVCITGTMSG